MTKRDVNERVAICLKERLVMEARYNDVWLGMEGKDEGGKAFLEKSPANFKGKL